jgi:DNA-binding NarL/FixJ family response regulator
LIAKGVPSKQIADKLNISIYTVNRHRQDILASLKVANTAAAVEIALRMNLI